MDPRRSDPPLTSELIARARAFALQAHGGQRYGERPYSYHLDAVAALLGPYGEAAQVVGYLHDVVEDTPVPLERVRETFGDHVAECVALVTDEPGESRSEKKARTNAKLSKVWGDARLALVVKAADRLANLRASAQDGGASKLEMYRREHPAFREAAFRSGLCDDLWAEIEQILSRGAGGNVPRADAVVRPERPADVIAIRNVHDAAFGGTGEGRLVDALRDAGKLVVSLVAETDGELVGHVGFSPVTSAAPARGFGLAPMAVRPDVQRRGIGGQLVVAGLAAVAEVGAEFVVVLGDPRYYGRFGFGPAAARGLADEFRGGDAFQVIELRDGAIPTGVGLVRYAPEFSILEGAGG